ncbi:MAG TPA: alpha/beta fold hydrolase [Thermoanaerobaculia bacterium]|nr:alpha/beta fold hydrolase [Thermoanaerobaculia bacterium]
MLSSRPLRHIDLYNDAGRLEALYRELENPAGVAVVCHPHPLHGGTLHNKVVFRAARGLEAANVATIRFNFRGAGSSHGRHDEGHGEQRDFETALRWIMQKHPGLPVLAGGFSFGAWVASRVGCETQEVRAIFLLGAPVNKYDLGYLKGCPKPKLILQGARDEFGDVDTLSALLEDVSDCETVIVADADHFFVRQLEVVEETIRDWAARTLKEE